MQEQVEEMERIFQRESEEIMHQLEELNKCKLELARENA